MPIIRPPRFPGGSRQPQQQGRKIVNHRPGPPPVVMTPPVHHRPPVPVLPPLPGAFPGARLAVLGGSGDAFLVLSLLGAFRARHGRSDVRVVLKPRLAALANLWGVVAETDDRLAAVEGDRAFQESYDNPFLDPSRPYYPHPCMLLTPIRVDRLTVKEASQADMYRLFLRLPPDAPMTLPLMEFRDPVHVRPGTVVLVEDSTSWPNTQPGFWRLLETGLRAAGWDVWVNDKARSLDYLLMRCAQAEWVIGPQCGVMSILVSGEFYCRKTLATPSLDGNRDPDYLAPETFPYAYVTKFAGADHDVEEHKITDRNHPEIVSAILSGANARRLWKHDPRPVMTVNAPLSPGDFLDRLAILAVKHTNFDGTRRAAVEREFLRFAEIRRQQNFPTQVESLFEDLVRHHQRTYELLGRVVPSALDGRLDPEDHRRAIEANKQRVEIKAEIDALCHAPYGEVKDYYQQNGGIDGLRRGVHEDQEVHGPVRADAR